MINHNLIKTGYDYEILFGADYFLTIIQAAYDYEKIPSEILIGETGTATVDRPHDAEILHDSDSADIRIFVILNYLLPVEIGLDLSITFDEDSVNLEFDDLDEQTKQLVVAIEGEDGLQKILDNLSAQVNQEVPISLGSNIIKIEVKKLAPVGEHKAVIGLYANANLKISGQSLPPETDFIERGNLSDALNFLPEEKSFAIGLSPTTFQRMANHAWHQTGELINDNLKHPIYDPKDIRRWERKLVNDPDSNKPDPIGKFISFSITPLNGFIRMVVKSRIYIDLWPDADVTAKFHLTPTLTDGNLVMDTVLDDYDIDTGLLGDFLAFITFGVLGIIALEIIESVAESETDDAVEETGKKQAEQAFSGLLSSFDLFTQRLDPFYITHIKLKHSYEEANINALGMSLSGKALIETEDKPVPVELIDKRRNATFSQFENLMSLFYRIPDFEGGDRIELLMNEVINRIPRKQLATVEMRPEFVHRVKTIVRDLKFSTGVDFTVDELIFLYNYRVLSIPKYELIVPRRSGVYDYVAHPYFRDKADKSQEDNLDELAPFKP